MSRYTTISRKLIVWVRNTMLLFLVSQLVYFAYQKFYLKTDVKWSSSIIAPVVPLILLQLALNKQSGNA